MKPFTILLLLLILFSCKNDASLTIKETYINIDPIKAFTSPEEEIENRYRYA